MIILVSPLAYAESNSEIKALEDVCYNTLIITDEDDIRNYLESLGEEYDPDLVAVYRTVRVAPNSDYTVSPAIFVQDYYLENEETRTYTDTSVLLKQYKRPAGIVSITDTVTVSTTYSIDAGIDIEILSSMLGVSLTQTHTSEVKWEKTYSYPVTICVYPIYQEFTGEVWDKDAIFDDLVGYYTIKCAIGDDLRVYRTAQV